jgi:hypothetical protein
MLMREVTVSPSFALQLIFATLSGREAHKLPPLLEADLHKKSSDFVIVKGHANPPLWARHS